MARFEKVINYINNVKIKKTILGVMTVKMFI